MKPKPVIVIDGTTSGLAVVRSLGERGVPVVVADYSGRAYAGFSKFVRANITLPDPTSAESDFVAALEECADTWGGSLLIPCSDGALVAVSRNKARLAREYVVGAPDWDAVQQVIEKPRAYELAASVGVPVPRTMFPRSLEDVRHFAEQIDYPCLVKPSQSHQFFKHFGKKVFNVTDATELTAAYRRSANAGLEVMLQEFIPGPDSCGSSLSSYRSGARLVARFSAATVRNAPPYHGSPRVVVSRWMPALERPTRRLLDAIGLNGFSCVEFKRDPRDGIHKLLDVNARYNVSVLLATRCGVDFPWTQYRHLLYGDEPTGSRFRSGVYWIDLPSDIAHSIRHLGREQASPLDLVRPYSRPHVFAVTSASDPAPSIRRVLRSVGRRLPGVTARWTRRSTHAR